MLQDRGHGSHRDLLSSSLKVVLAFWILVFFSHIELVTMAAEAPDPPPMGGLGHVEEAKNGLTRGNTTGARERENFKEINCMVYFVLGEGVCYIFIPIHVTANSFSSALG